MDNEKRKSDGRKMAALRKQRGFKTQRQLAEHLHLNMTTVARMECGKTPVPRWMWLILKHERGDGQ